MLKCNGVFLTEGVSTFMTPSYKTLFYFSFLLFPLLTKSHKSFLVICQFVIKTEELKYIGS